MADWIKAKIMDRYFERIGNAAKGTGTCAQIIGFKLGFGYVNEGTMPPTLLTIPSDLADIPEVFLEGVPEITYSGGTLLCRCLVPVGTLAEAHKASMAGLFDQDDNLVAACAFYPDWTTPDEEYRVNIGIVFPVGD